MFIRSKVLPESEINYDREADRYVITAPARFASLLGLKEEVNEKERLPLSDHLFDYQKFIVDKALNNRRFACWCDTGLGKSHIFIEWARQVCHLMDGRVLIFSPLQVIPQTIQLAADYFGINIDRILDREELGTWCKGEESAIGICNYEKLIPGVMPELRYLAGLVADEASILKTQGGVIKWNLMKSAYGIEYKLACTATPAPNDVFEYLSQAGFLDKFNDSSGAGATLAAFFTRGKDNEWRLKGHAREAFYRFMASWSIYMRNPVNFGFHDILNTLPPPEIHEYKIDITPAQREWMHAFQTRNGKGFFNDRAGVKERLKLGQIAKGFLYETTENKRSSIMIDSNKPAFIADLVRQDKDLQVLVWTVFDAETEILARELNDIEYGALHGSMSDRDRQEVLDRFQTGELRVLISKASLIGYGLNLQHCRSMIFSGFDDSFERMYQAIRRAYRYGQTETVKVHIPYIPELEGMIFENIQAKERQFIQDVTEQEKYYREALGL
jgi:hypothetical protein